VLGGGHSPLSSIYGIAADHVLAMELVTPDGRFVTASSSTNKDLFWALRGGSGGTFGVVTSVTIRAHPKIVATVVSFSFSTATMSTTTFWAGVRSYFDYFIMFSDKGTYSYFFLYPFGVYSFIMQPFFAPNMTTKQTKSLLKPWFDRLAALGIEIDPVYTTYDNFYDAWQEGFPLESVGRDGQLTASRLFPRSNWQNPTTLNETFEAWAASVRDYGTLLINFNFAPRNYLGVENAVNPAFRNTVMHAIQGATVPTTGTPAEQLAVRNLITARQAAWINVSPGAGAYLGEADAEEPNFQQSFYGTNYARLLSIKKKVDPKNVFWVRTGVGSEVMKVNTSDVLQGENGRLCYI
jgi:FAD/FMN-containing dehydrogenase